MPGRDLGVLLERAVGDVGLDDQVVVIVELPVLQVRVAPPRQDRLAAVAKDELADPTGEVDGDVTRRLEELGRGAEGWFVQARGGEVGED